MKMKKITLISDLKLKPNFKSSLTNFLKEQLNLKLNILDFLKDEKNIQTKNNFIISIAQKLEFKKANLSIKIVLDDQRNFKELENILKEKNTKISKKKFLVQQNINNFHIKSTYENIFYNLIYCISSIKGVTPIILNKLKFKQKNSEKIENFDDLIFVKNFPNNLKFGTVFSYVKNKLNSNVSELNNFDEFYCLENLKQPKFSFELEKSKFQKKLHKIFSKTPKKFLLFDFDGKKFYLSFYEDEIYLSCSADCFSLLEKELLYIKELKLFNEKILQSELKDELKRSILILFVCKIYSTECGKIFSEYILEIKKDKERKNKFYKIFSCLKEIKFGDYRDNLRKQIHSL